MGYAIKDGHFRVDSRLVGHWLRREIQIQVLGLDDSNYLHQGGYLVAQVGKLSQKSSNTRQEVLKSSLLM